MSNRKEPHSEFQEFPDLDTSHKENQNSTVNSKADNHSESENKNQESENSQTKENSASFGDFLKKQHDSQVFDELLKTVKATNIYVDNRTGGIYSGKEINIGGDAVGHDQTKLTKFSSQSWHTEETVEYVLKNDIEKTKKVYIKLQKYEILEKILDKNNILILKGDSQLGKRATSINLLSAFETENILEISPNIKSINSFTCKENQYYLIDNPSVESINEINNLSLRKLSRHFKNKKSYLIIIIDSQIELSEEILKEYGISFSRRDLPIGSELLNKHLLWYLKQDLKSLQLSKSINDIISHPQILELLESQLFPCDIDRLAESLAKVINQELNLEDALAHFNLIVRKQVKTWFETHQNFKQRLFMITLAVLSGSSFQTVKDANQKLQLQLLPSLNEEDNTLEIVEQIFDSRSQLLEEVQAHLRQGVENTEYGSSSVELIVLNNSQYQPIILSYIWHEYDNLRTPFLDWLLELGKSQKKEIRIKVAAAIGYLGQQDFSIVRSQILVNWANCSDKNSQISAAIALTVPVRNGILVSEILGLLHHWSTLKNHALHKTTIEAYGRGIGIRYPATALRDLSIIANSCNRELPSDISLFWDVVDVVISIFHAGQYRNSLTVLNALNVWAKMPEQQSFKSLIIFQKIMADSKIKLEYENRELPILLFLAKADEEHEKIIFKLLKRLLNAKGKERILQKSTLEELHKWLNFVDKDQVLFKTFARIIILLFYKGNKQEKGRIIFYLNRWYLKDKSSTAQKILDVLEHKKLATK